MGELRLGDNLPGRKVVKEVVTSEQITFEIQLRAPGTGGEPDVSTIKQFRPAAEDIIRCQRWFAAHGVEAHSTGFGLLHRATRAI